MNIQSLQLFTNAKPNLSSIILYPWFLIDEHRLIFWTSILESLSKAGWNEEPAGCSLTGCWESYREDPSLKRQGIFLHLYQLLEEGLLSSSQVVAAMMTWGRNPAGLPSNIWAWLWAQVQVPLENFSSSYLSLLWFSMTHPAGHCGSEPLPWYICPSWKTTVLHILAYVISNHASLLSFSMGSWSQDAPCMAVCPAFSTRPGTWQTVEDH